MDFRTCAAVLLVEDDESLRRRLATFLEGEGFRVHQAATGAEALQVLPSMARPSLILADLVTSTIDSTVLLTSLDPDDRFVILPVVVSGAGSGPSESRLQKKPIDLADLLRIVESLCFRRI